MLVPVQWLKEFVDFSMSAQELADALTMAGLETALEEEDILEIDITPNRGDCLSILGVAREVAALMGAKVKMPEVQPEESFRPEFTVRIGSPLCRRYAGRIIKGVRVGPSPEWMVRRLEACGLRSINNIVDVTNYVLLEMGHPLHAFDLNTLRDATIRVDIMKQKGRFRTLDGAERQIPPEALMIWDGKGPVAIAGIMGGEETEVRDDTTDIFLESAYFEPTSIRRTSRALGLRTESSIRFERGTDIEGLITALDRAAYLISSIAGGQVSERIDVYAHPKEPTEVNLREGFLKAHLGIELSIQEARDCLQRLGFEVKERTETSIAVMVPSYRNDVRIEVDLVEEIARAKGYQSIPSRVPEADISGEGLSEQRKCLNTIRQLLVNEGFFEAVNYSFIDPKHLDALGIASGDIRRRFLQMENPLSTEQSIMRTFLLPGLIESLARTLARGVKEVRLFESGRVFIAKDSPDELPDESVHLAAILYQRKGHRLWQSDIDMFYQIKGVLEKVLHLLGVQNYTFEPSSESFLHPGRSGTVLVQGVALGYTGVLSPETKRAYDLDSYKEDIGVFEVDLSHVLNYRTTKKTFKHLPRFPYVQRDISVLLPRDRTVAQALEFIKSFPSEYIEHCWVFDLYEGKSIPEGFRSVGISVVYRAKDRTLTEEEVEALHQAILKGLLETTGARLR